MRNAFLNSLTTLAKNDDRLFFITGDLGFGVFEDFEKNHPNQFLNVGVAEQNMASIAAGMALEGRKVFIYSIGNFPTLRCLEQIRNDICYHNADVKIIGMGGGFSYGQLGMSHHTTEDISILRALPNMTVVVPGTEREVVGAMDSFKDLTSPAYLRLDKSKAEDLPSIESFELGKCRQISDGNALTIITAGGILSEVVLAEARLRKKGISCRILSMHTIKPLDVDAIKKAIQETDGILTVEENNYLGGLGGAVSEYCLESDVRPKLFRRLGIQDVYPSIVGDQSYLRAHYGLDNLAIEKTVLEMLHTDRNEKTG